MTYTLKYKGISEIVGRKHVMYELIIEEAHPENVQYVYDRLKSSKREPTQKTLEVL